MSYLLDALRKSELERKVGEVPDLTPDWSLQPAERKRPPYLVLVIGLLLINVGTLFYITLRERGHLAEGEENRPASEKTSSLSASPEHSAPNNFSELSLNTAPGKGPLPVPDRHDSATAGNRPEPVKAPDEPDASEKIAGAQPKTTAPVATRKDQRPATRENLSAVPRTQPAKPKPLATPSPGKQPAIDAAKPSPPGKLLAKLEAPKSERVESRPIHQDSVIPESARGNLATNEDQEPIPWLNRMPTDFQREVPSLNINVFVYSEDPDERFVIVNMSKYLTGQKIDGGPQILEIRADSLVLDYQGREFRIRRP